MNITGLDWAIVAVPVLLVTALAIFARTFVRGVSDFLAAGRSAGRYLICNAEGAASMGAITIVAIFEQISNGGPAMMFWALLATPTVSRGSFPAFFFSSSQPLVIGMLGLTNIREALTNRTMFRGSERHRPHGRVT